MKKAEMRKDRATFSIEIRYRQHGSWQGIVKWLDSEEEMCFRSTLELLKILDSVQAEVATSGLDTDVMAAERKVANLL